MTVIGENDRRNLETLLRLAAAEAQALAADLSDMARARTSAAKSLEAMDAKPAGAVDERRLGRRRGLMMTLDVLARAEDRARRKLADVEAEAAKLRRLLASAGLAGAGHGILRRAS